MNDDIKEFVERVGTEPAEFKPTQEINYITSQQSKQLEVFKMLVERSREKTP